VLDRVPLITNNETAAAAAAARVTKKKINRCRRRCMLRRDQVHHRRLHGYRFHRLKFSSQHVLLLLKEEEVQKREQDLKLKQGIIEKQEEELLKWVI
jgi:hypothetical protein